MDLVVNAGVGALTAGLRAHFAGRPFWSAFKHGAVGGAVNYAGKRVVGTRKPALGFVGRQVAAVGASMVRNASDGRAALASAVLPFGPIRVYVGEPGVRFKLDLAGSIGLAYTATRLGARFDAGASFAAGTPVFKYYDAPTPYHIAENNAGVIGLLYGLEGDSRRRAIAHELVHVAQYDFSFIAWGEPAERALLPQLPASGFVHRYVDLGVNMAAWGLAEWRIPHDQRPWEREALLMTDRPWP